MSWTNSQKQAFDESYSKTSPKQTVNNRNLDIFIKSASPKVVDAVCDVGGGAGANLDALRRKIEEHYGHRVKTSIVCDISAEGLRKAKSTGLQTVQSSATHLPFRNGSFDAVLYVHVLEHIANDFLALKETGRIVRKGGCLYFGTPNKATNLYLPLIIDVHLLLRNPLHLRSGYDSEKITSQLRLIGFKRLFLEYHGFWGVFFIHVFGYLFWIFQSVFRKCLAVQLVGVQNKVQWLNEKFLRFDEHFSSSNSHGINFFMILRKATSNSAALLSDE